MVKSNQVSSQTQIKNLLPYVKNKARKTELMLKLKFELKKQKKKEKELRKKERERTGQPVRFM
jgi:hypothetical protein